MRCFLPGSSSEHKGESGSKGWVSSEVCRESGVHLSKVCWVRFSARRMEAVTGLDQWCPIELSAKTETLYICTDQHGSHRLLSTWAVASAIEQLNFQFDLIWSNPNLNWNSHMWLVATLLDRAIQIISPPGPAHSQKGSPLCRALQYLGPSSQIPSYSSEPDSTASLGTASSSC